MSLTLAEMETVIRFDRESNIMIVWSADPVMMRRLDKNFTAASEQKNQEGEIVGKTYEIDKSLLKIRPKRKVSEEQKQSLRERMLCRNS
jgi:hypothetical protein